MKKGNYITIQSWMFDLPIDGNELIVYALIYGFSQDGKSFFKGSYPYMSEMTKISERTLFRIIEKLRSLNLIEKVNDSFGRNENKYKTVINWDEKNNENKDVQPCQNDKVNLAKSVVQPCQNGKVNLAKSGNTPILNIYNNNTIAKESFFSDKNSSENDKEMMLESSLKDVQWQSHVLRRLKVDAIFTNADEVKEIVDRFWQNTLGAGSVDNFNSQLLKSRAYSYLISTLKNKTEKKKQEEIIPPYLKKIS